jgi:beta-phosphoglucomutase family hydrolase
VLGLPERITACLFDLDGVLTNTAEVHKRAWKETFDAFLAERAGAGGFDEFTDADYARHVDGRARADGVRTCLASRDIELPEGAPADGPDEQTINGVGNRKNELLNSVIARDGVMAYPGSVRYLEAVSGTGLGIAVVSSSANAGPVLEAAGLSHFVHVRVDGLVIAERGLAGKPAPDSFLAAARKLGIDPSQGAVFEDALAGVEAGRAGVFGFVVGVNREDQAAELARRGADIVVNDLAELLESE